MHLRSGEKNVDWWNGRIWWEVSWETIVWKCIYIFTILFHLNKLEPDCLVISKIGQVGLFFGFRWTLGTFFQLVRLGDHINHLRPGNQIKMVHKLLNFYQQNSVWMNKSSHGLSASINFWQGDRDTSIFCHIWIVLCQLVLGQSWRGIGKRSLVSITDTLFRTNLFPEFTGKR